MNRVAVLFAAFFMSALAGSPQTLQPPPLEFRTGVNLIVVDVSVLDDRRLPVRGLTAADFTILEDGRPQPIVVFSAIDVPDIEMPATTWMREVAPDVQSNVDQADRRLLVVVLDDATPMPAVDVPRVRRVARQVIDRLGPRDLAAVVYVLNKRRGQEFTTDHQRLLEALDYFNGGVGGMAFSPSAVTMYRATLGTLEGVIESLADLPDRRKAVVFVSVGLPLGSEAAAPGGIGEGAVYARGVAQDLINQTFDIFRAAQRVNVNIYGLDPGGLRVADWPLNREFLQALSENTGGLAIVQTNDPLPGIVQMFRENGSYYLLGYEAPTPQSYDRYRRIEVRVNRPGVTVRSRRGYLEPRRPASPKPGAKPVEPPSAVAGPRDRLASLLPVMPTTQREFWGHEQATAFLRAYQPGRNPLVPVLVKARIVDARSAEVFTRAERLEPARFGSTRSADYALILPLGGLSPGAYLLTVEAALASPSGSGSGTATGCPIRRDVRFSVR